MPYERNIGSPKGASRSQEDTPPQSEPPTQEGIGTVHDSDRGSGIEDKAKEGRRKGSEVGHPTPQPLSKKARVIDSTTDVESSEGLPPADLISPRALKLPGLVRSRFWFLAVGFFVALILLFVLSHTVSVVRDIQDLPLPLMWVTAVLLGVILIVIAIVAIRGLWVVLKLSKGFQLQFDQIKASEDRIGEKAYAVAKTDFLLPYLEKLCEKATEPSTVYAKCLSEKEQANLVQSARWLLDPQRAIGSRAWTEEYLKKIQTPIENAARSRVSMYGKAAAVKTAVSPWPLIDTSAVIYNATLMVKDVAELFNHRFSRFDSFRLLLNLMVAIYFSAESQEAIESLQEDGLSETGAAGLEKLAFSGADVVLKTVTGKISEGAVNYLFMRRIGKRAIKMLKPVS